MYLSLHVCTRFFLQKNAGTRFSRSFKNLHCLFNELCFVQDISGSSLLMAMGSLMRKPGFSSLPQSYMKAGVSLYVSRAAILNFAPHLEFCVP